MSNHFSKIIQKAGTEASSDSLGTIQLWETVKIVNDIYKQ